MINGTDPFTIFPVEILVVRVRYQGQRLQVMDDWMRRCALWVLHTYYCVDKESHEACGLWAGSSLQLSGFKSAPSTCYICVVGQVALAPRYQFPHLGVMLVPISLGHCPDLKR